MLIKKFFVIISAAVMINLSNSYSFKSEAQSSPIIGECTYGGIWEDLNNYDDTIVINETRASQNSNSNLRTIPSSYDITTNNSTAQYFPPVGNQGEINSCSGWATTYYQFTYEVNKFKNTPTTVNNIYSPSWTYNYINGGSNNAVELRDAYAVLKHQGAMYLTDYPHTQYLSDYSFAWPTDLEKMRNALEYRATYSVCNVSEFDSEYIDDAKEIISSGKIGVILTDPLGWDIETNVDNQKVVVRSHSDPSNRGGHYMAVVGYDDNFEVTVGGQTLTGAFKLVNSAGSSWGNNGYIWVSYDALLYFSEYGTSWQTGMNYIRTPVFGSNNMFCFLNVYHCDVYFSETVQFTSYYPWDIDIYGDNGTTPYNRKKYASETGGALSIPDTRYIVFDYTDPGVSLDVNNYMSTTWLTHLEGNPINITTYDISARLTDNLGNDIVPFNNVYYAMLNGVYEKPHVSNIAKGRVTAYDNNEITMDDVQAVQNYLLELIDFSSLQKFLADYNSDGTVNMSDVICMVQHISEINGSRFSLYDNLPGLDYSLADFIENELNISISDFIDENSYILNESNV